MIAIAFSITQHIIQTKKKKKKKNNDKCQCECKKYCMCKKDCTWNSSTCICQNSRYLKCIANDLVIIYDEVINIKNSLSINWVNTISKNVTSTVSVTYKITKKCQCQ